MIITSGNSGIDSFLEGGYDNEITVIYGPAGTGKTTLCLQAALCQAENKKVLFLDTEINFSVDRIKQLLNGRNINTLDNILVTKVKSFKIQQDQIKNIASIIKTGKFSLIIIDSIGHFYRSLLKKKPDLANKMLYSQLKMLKDISKRLPVIITNQVYTDIDTNTIKMVGNNIISEFSNKTLRLENLEKRVIYLLKPMRKTAYFKILETGIEII